MAETGLGNVRDKQAKNSLAATKTPGVEDVESAAYTDEHGLTLVERAPWGVIGAITPVTNPIATITSNAIGMIAAGNSVVFNVHPGAKRISVRLVGMLSEAIEAAGGPRNILCAVGRADHRERRGADEASGCGASGGDRGTRGGAGGDGKREEGDLRGAGQSALRGG